MLNITIREMQKNKTNLQGGIASHQSEGHHQKNFRTINAGEDVEKRKSSCIIGENVNRQSRCRETVW